MPVYYVICTYVQNTNQYGLYQILETVECNLEDVQAGRVNTQKWYDSRQFSNVQAYIFLREPPNPFREGVNE